MMITQDDKWMKDNEQIAMIEDLSISNMFPALGSALAARSSLKNKEAHRFMQDVLVEVNAKLWRLEHRIDKEYMRTADFLNFLHKTLVKVALDLRKEKLKLFANIIVNSTLIGNADENDNRKYLFDETIDKIDERLFEFLLRMKSRHLTTNDENNEGWKGSDDELKLLGVDDRTFSLYADYLLGVGVVVRIPRLDMEQDDGTLYYTNEYYVTQYGLEFVEYVKETDNTYDAG
ncbi:MAG: hypothetical protein J5965_14500 [Aeriscardovia sp.]|nr:hypothetical protein [Aeriscardovia sp.]